MSAHDSVGRSPAERDYRVWSWMNIDNLHPHPLNAKLYAESVADPVLVESIKQVGVLEPIVFANMPVDADGNIVEDRFEDHYCLYIVSGHRRFFAAKAAGLKKVPVRAIHGGANCTDNILGVEQFLIESNRQRVKTDLQIQNEVRELTRIEAELAKQRQGYRRRRFQDKRTHSNKRGNRQRRHGTEGGP